MLHHVSVGVRDLERASNFYDVVLGTLGYNRVMEVLPVAVAYGIDQPTFWVQLPHNQQIATAGNGTHISFVAHSQEAVDAFHAAAIELGAQNAGEPGPRPDYSPDYYGAFVYDLDGNKLEATLVHVEQPAAKKSPRKAAKKAVKKKAAKPLAKKSAKKVASKTAPKAAQKAVKKATKKVARVIQVIAVPKPSKGKNKAKPGKIKPAKKDKKDKKGKKNKKAKS
ncbi:MAG: VOC family protein [Rhizomicrobium sp.]|nr:VOC family protein [Rhizomicrobium sp.]